MKILSCTVSQDGKSAELLTDEGRLSVFGAAENIVRCVYTKREEVLPVSPIGIECERKAGLRMEEKDGAYQFETSRISLNVEKQTGRFLWRDKKSDRLLLREGKKELAESPLMVYSTGGEKPMIRRVLTVDGERNFVENLNPTMDHMAYRGKLYFDWDEEEHIHGLGQGEEGIYDYRGNVRFSYPIRNMEFLRTVEA